jgi:hypothetical protein
MKQASKIDLLADEIGSSFSWTSDLKKTFTGHPSSDLNPLKP